MGWVGGQPFTRVLLVIAAGCGDNLHPAPDLDAAIRGPRYEPWAVGAQWSYKITDPTGVLPTATNKLTTVVGVRDVGGVHAGKQAFLVHIETLVGSKDVYEAVVGDLDVRYRSSFYDSNNVEVMTDVWLPYRLKLDESAAHIAAGAQFAETFTQTKIRPGMAPSTSTRTNQWMVINPNEQITVLAGTFTALHIRRTNSKRTIQDYWYVRGVGKVKATGGAEDEELEWFRPGDDSAP